LVIDGFDGPYYFEHCSDKKRESEIALELFEGITSHCWSQGYTLIKDNTYYDDNYNTCLEVVFAVPRDYNILGQPRTISYKYVIYDKKY
jgi:hypothetical protein